MLYILGTKSILSQHDDEIIASVFHAELYTTQECNYFIIERNVFIDAIDVLRRMNPCHAFPHKLCSKHVCPETTTLWCHV